MFDSGSVQKCQVVGLPDTGTDVNESACPFDLESPQKVWISNANFKIPCGHPLSHGKGRAYSCAPTLADCWEFRAKMHDCIVAEGGDPIQITIEDAFSRARRKGHSWLIVRLGNGRIIEEYPL